MQNKFLEYISKFVKLDIIEAKAISSEVSVKKYQAGDVLLKEGLISQISYFILHRCVR